MKGSDHKQTREWVFYKPASPKQVGLGLVKSSDQCFDLVTSADMTITDDLKWNVQVDIIIKSFQAPLLTIKTPKTPDLN